MDSATRSPYDRISSSSDEDDDRVPIPTTRATRSSAIGRIRTVHNVHLIEWGFIALSAVSILTGFGFTIYRMSTIAPDSDQYVFAILVMINLVFATFYMLHGVFQEQPFEILMYIFTTLLLGALLTINFASSTPERDRIRLIRFLVTMILSAPTLVIGCSLGWQYWSSGALVFKTVGADMKLQRMCRTYFFGLSLLVFDAQMGLSCVILVMQKGLTGMTNVEIVILVTGAAFLVIWLGVAYVGLRTENIKLTWIFAIISIVQPLYVLYLFVQSLDVDLEKPYSLRVKCAFFAGVILLLVHFTLLSVLLIIGSHFGHGLKVANESGNNTRNSGNSGRCSIEDDEPLIDPAGPGPSRQNYEAIP